MAGRPKKQLDTKTFEKLCEIQCTQIEICNVFNVDHKTLNRWCIDTYGEEYSQVYEKFSADGKQSLRRAQFKMAQNNPTMAIWLGKQILGQRDKSDHDITGNLSINVKWDDGSEHQTE